MEICNVCNSDKDVVVKEEVGRGNPPKGYKRHPGDRRLISWKGIWSIYTCSCGNTWAKLKEE